MSDMTARKKAREISDSYYMPDTGFDRDDLYDSAMEMAEWKEQQMIEKACEWLKDNAGDSYLDWYDWEKCRLNKDELLHDFREAMEEQLFMGWKYYPKEFSSYEEYVKYLKEKGLALEAPEGHV